MTSKDRQSLIDIITALTTNGGTGRTTPLERVLISAALLSGLLEVDSLILDRDGQVDIVLKGCFKGQNNSENNLENNIQNIL